MDKKSIDEITHRVISDTAFRKKLIANPEGALREAGYSVEPEDAFLKTIKAASVEHLEEAAREYEKNFPGGSGSSGGPMG